MNTKTNKQKTFYITTPLYYPSGKWHLGHSYTTVCCDAIARYKRMAGYDVFYLTGTDEHGQKIEERAAAAETTPKEYVDALVDDIQKLWRLLNISYDKFIRTTDDYHVKSVETIFKALYDKGDIYKSKYSGKYCTPCEAFWTASQLKDGKCPDCGRKVIESEEESYFFRLSKYADRLEKLLTETEFLQPKFRVSEMVNNFIKPGLNDLAVSRTSVKWGIPVSFDDKHTVYVWIDALSNYINALGYNGDNNNMNYWPADIHMVGKEIVRFHSIIWPALLMALDLPVPKTVYGHGWLLLEGDKMSKSKGNVADPFRLVSRYGVDAIRYYLLREIPFGSDGVYSDESLLNRINSDLVNDLGNLVKRTVAMAKQYFGGKVEHANSTDADSLLVNLVSALNDKVEAAMNLPSCSKALEEIFAVIGAANKYIDENAPWALFKNGQTDRLQTVLYILLEAIRVCATLLCPFIIDGSKRIFEILNLPVSADFKAAKFGAVKKYTVNKDEILYARLDIKKELEELNKDEIVKTESTQTAKEKQPDSAAKPAINADFKKESSPTTLPTANADTPADGMITIDEFSKIDLRIAEVIAAEKVEKTEKLLKLTVKLGDEMRTVVSGIAKAYSPESMVGKKVVLVYNLNPAKLRGIESRGMILCASDGDELVLVSPERDVKSGSEVR